jgi:FtsP/CotA-like multicopper oxidase with cupredoxin domain
VIAPLLVASLLGAGGHPPRATQAPVVVPNDNRVAAGRRAGDTVVVQLVARRATWRLDGDGAPGLTALAFAEDGGAPRIPGPLLRARVGTTFRVRVRNPLDDTLFVHGLASHRRTSGAADDSLIVLPHTAAETRFLVGVPGTYLYWAATSHTTLRTMQRRQADDGPLTGALVVDPPGPAPHDRVLVISGLSDTLDGAGENLRDGRNIRVRSFHGINGRAWPHTERFAAHVGDTLQWRVLNGSAHPHPMHLHGAYFRVDALGDGVRDSTYAPDLRPLVVTQLLRPGQTMAMTWSPDRPGTWLFHCHLNIHTEKLPPLDRPDVFHPLVDHHADPDHHVELGMGGMLLAVTVSGGAWPRHVTAPDAPPASARHLRLWVQSDSTVGDRWRRYGYVLEDGAPPARDSVPAAGPILVLTRGEPTAIDVVNRLDEPTAVHWHGMEIDNYYDGVVGLGGVGPQRTPAVRPGATFEVRVTPVRAGTFMFHSHFHDVQQQAGGLVGGLIVLEPGAHWDRAHDLPLLLSDRPDLLGVRLNGADVPTAIELRAGETYRLRLMNGTIGKPLLVAEIARDGEPVTWRAIAKDGRDLPPAQRTLRPSRTMIADGETMDFELMIEQPGDLTLHLTMPAMLATTVPLRVR